MKFPRMFAHWAALALAITSAVASTTTSTNNTNTNTVEVDHDAMNDPTDAWDLAKFVAGGVLTGGSIYVYKLFGVYHRCRQDAAQSEETCANQDGCVWIQAENKCRASAFLGTVQLLQDRNRKCIGGSDPQNDMKKNAPKRTQPECKKLRACYWHKESQQCQVRVLYALNRARHADPNLDQAERDEQFRNQNIDPQQVLQ